MCEKVSDSRGGQGFYAQGRARRSQPKGSGRKSRVCMAGGSPKAGGNEIWPLFSFFSWAMCSWIQRASVPEPWP